MHFHVYFLLPESKAGHASSPSSGDGQLRLHSPRQEKKEKEKERKGRPHPEQADRQISEKKVNKIGVKLTVYKEKLGSW